MHSEQNRVLNYAVLASIVLHGALLSSVPQRERMRMAEPPPLVARLAEPPPAVVPAPPPVVTPAAPEAVKPTPRPKAAATKPITKAPSPRMPVTEPKTEAPQAEVKQPEAAAPAAPKPAPPTVTARSEPAPSVQPPAPAAEPVPDQTSVAQYRLQLISAARKFKNYPRLAMENNWEGDVVVRMAFGDNGTLAGLSVQSSSGHKVLDQQALEMFKKAAAAVFLPPALHGREFSIEVRAVYNLRDQSSG